MAAFGPALLRIEIVKGEATQKAKRKEVLSQLMAVSEVLKYSAEVFDTGEYDSQTHDTMILSNMSCANPKKRRL
jgi:hypothetical protein